MRVSHSKCLFPCEFSVRSQNMGTKVQGRIFGFLLWLVIWGRNWTVATCYTLCDLFVLHLWGIPPNPTRQENRTGIRLEVKGQNCEEEVFFFFQNSETHHSHLIWQPFVSQGIQTLVLPITETPLNAEEKRCCVILCIFILLECYLHPGTDRSRITQQYSLWNHWPKFWPFYFLFNFFFFCKDTIQVFYSQHGQH